MKQNDKDNQSHYCVLYTQTLKQWEVTTVLKKKLPEGRGTVFYPCIELWRHDRKATEIRALFPGYLFIRSDMEPEELHHFIGEHRRDVSSFIKELRISEKKISGGDAAEQADEANGYQYIRMDLKEDEKAFLDFLLACGNEDTGQEADGDAEVKDGTCREDTRKAGICKNSDGEESVAALRIPTEGVLRMSYGYREGGKYVVMKGPLKEYQNRIARVNAHDRKAYLDIKINGRAVRAGFEVKPKRYWFPDDSDAPMVLHDGTEVNLENLRNMMMGAKKQR
ncbi:transcription termination/antitermination NusG family protein [Schaedlerella arabinosiphila]|uniref:transcription termination/antitermination NusG family protein n=1 Tax=Schaedlerella arabinosiphila TaxID=2044587 RepID=UPI0025583A68|nr:transcription termination/antitermination NusG family protein [Schaedlerella arabinosiphila]